ncbi:hypothetical protein KGQ20_03895 [Catenulispora sp. NF23]|uniref:Uncharacterized protein n=1 Tax=Catenulispora pinistramenti TaxID=2705254 RepID=A0ABS5KMX3_9ACTN|nr:hypothetical protein [Catenulispora pinistramenti]MBS2531909.1 hypothetical protein [Catenulispora pinistramenti]MBS2547388.1 hypothetical protein [Catenulispora pinistramenti]
MSVLMSMQTTRPVIHRGSSAPGLLLPSGTPASQPVPLSCWAGGLGLVTGAEGFVVGGVDGFDVDDGALGEELDRGSEDVEVEVEPEVEVEVEELLAEAGNELLVPADVGVGVGVGALDEEVVEDVPTPAAACCTLPVVELLLPPEPVEHPVMPIATAPATASNAPALPTPDVPMPL